jgi:hypothetical protein
VREARVVIGSVQCYSGVMGEARGEVCGCGDLQVSSCKCNLGARVSWVIVVVDAPWSWGGSGGRLSTGGPGGYGVQGNVSAYWMVWPSCAGLASCCSRTESAQPVRGRRLCYDWSNRPSVSCREWAGLADCVCILGGVVQSLPRRLGNYWPVANTTPCYCCVLCYAVPWAAESYFVQVIIKSRGRTRRTRQPSEQVSRGSAAK